jgi:hypothetical protein
MKVRVTFTLSGSFEAEMPLKDVEDWAHGDLDEAILDRAGASDSDLLQHVTESEVVDVMPMGWRG